MSLSRINGQLIVKLRELGLDTENDYIVEEVADRSTWEIKGNEVIFVIEFLEDYEDVAKDIENIKLVASFKDRDIEIDKDALTEGAALHDYYKRETI